MSNKNAAPAEARPADDPQPAFSASLEKITSQVPEAAEKIEAIKQAGDHLIDEFEIQPDLFEDDGKAMVFTAIAERWSRVDEAADPQTADGERAFLADNIALLAYEHSPKLAPLKEKIEAEGCNLTPQQELAVFDKYTNQKLGADLQAAINGGLLDEVKSRLGITPETEDAYDVRVLNVDKDGMNSNGVTLPFTVWEDIPGDHAAKSAVFAEQSEAYDKLQAEQKAYQDDAVAMAAELGLNSELPTAWVTKLGEDERVTLCLSAPLVQKILDPELTRHSSYYGADDRSRDIAMLEHEYTHTQGNLNVGRHTWFGINLEELRAEAFSGDKTGYQDIKGFFNDTAIVSGLRVTDAITSKPKGGTQPEIFGELANQFGLSGMLEILSAAPRSYINDQSNVYQRAIHEYTGGYDGVTQGLVDREVALGHSAEIDQRVAKVAVSIRKVTTDADSRKFLIKYRRHMGLNVMTNKLAAELEKLGDKDLMPVAA